MVKLSEEFINRYKNIEPPMTQLGSFVYYRTYSRFIPELNRREYWYETCKRAVEYNCNLVEGVSQDEAEQLFDNIFNLRQFPSGRTLWVGGTESSKSSPMSQFNCSGTKISGIDDICDLFYLMMLGVGVGFRIMPEDVAQLPQFNKNSTVKHLEYNEVLDNKQEETTLDNNFEIVIGDSKSGWTESLRMFLNILSKKRYFKKGISIAINYNNIRRKGSPLKTFGGIASGPESLMLMFERIYDIIQKSEDGILSTLDCLDICNLVGNNVLTGGQRRVAGIGMFDVNDTDVMTAKNKIYYEENGEWKTDESIKHRTNSNNTIIFWEKPSLEKLREIFESIKISAEPGFYNGQTARKRFPEFEVTNPCGEVLLANHSLCNLTTINMMSVIKDNEIDVELLDKLCIASARLSYRLACVELELPHWNEVQQQHMLLGCSLTGWQDMVNELNLSMEVQKQIMRRMKNIINKTAKDYAKELGRNESRMTTTLKPEGTLSLLPTVSPGLHYSHSPYYIRRVRIAKHDPLVNVCEELGYNITPEGNTKVIDFYVKSPDGKTKFDVSAIEQLELYKIFMDEYVEQNASNTITVRNSEWEDVIDWIYNNWDSFVGVSFLSLDDTYYPLMPYESITEEQYNEYIKSYPTQNITPEMIAKYETTGISDIGDSECSSGICPIR